mmetsp:Transcript_9651/g.18437  ORF Transcript_9651/g.18437 Transcript_9651/m.18437 type:complete len:318 (+) Transcript_9651:163-1116(+)
MIQCHMLWNGQGRGVLQLWRFVEDNITQVRRKRRWLSRVIIHVRHVVGKDFPVSIRLGSTGRGRPDIIFGVGRVRGRATVFRRGFFFLKLSVTGIGLEIRHINKIIDATFNVGDGGLIGGKPPFIVHNKFKGMLASFEIVNVGKIITRPVHRDLTTPSIKCPRNVDLPSPVFPPKNRWHRVIIEPIFDRSIRIARVVMSGTAAITRNSSALISVRHGHARITTRPLHGTVKVGWIGSTLRGGRGHKSARWIPSYLSTTLLMIRRHSSRMSGSIHWLLISHGGTQILSGSFGEKMIAATDVSQGTTRTQQKATKVSTA